MKNTICFHLLWIAIATLHLFPLQAKGQNSAIDTGRMERDIDIMEKVLNELFDHSPSDTRLFKMPPSADKSAQGSYIPGFGVIFIAPAYASLMTSPIAGTNPKLWKGTASLPSGKTTIREEPEVAAKTLKEKTLRGAMTTQVNKDSVLQAQIGLVTKNMKEFLVNYADAMGQLQADNHILLIYNENARNKARYFIITDENETSILSMPRISAQVKREDISSYRAGKINRKELENRIKINQEREEKETYSEYKVFAGILESLYPLNELSSYRVRNISYHYLPSFGVIYFIDMSLQNELFPTSTLPYKVATSVTDTEQIKADSIQNSLKAEAYEQFQKEIRVALLDYGRTLRNLSSEQVILLTVSLPTCKGCQAPERVNVSIKKSVIDAYEQNRLDRKAALDSIYIETVSTQK